MKDGIEKLCTFCKEKNIPFIMGFSGGKGVHVSVFFGDVKFDKELIDRINQTDIDVFKTVRRALVVDLAKKAGINLDNIGMNWGKILFNLENKGSQVRTFGTTRASGLYKTLIDGIPDHKPKPHELPLIFPEKVELWGIRGTEFENVVLDALKIKVERAKKANEYTFTNVDFSGIEILEFPCIRMLFESGLRNGRYYAGISVLLMCEKCGITKNETEIYLRKLFVTFPNITPSETDLRMG